MTRGEHMREAIQKKIEADRARIRELKRAFPGFR
jgi:hypothetical protein